MKALKIVMFVPCSLERGRIPKLPIQWVIHRNGDLIASEALIYLLKLYCFKN